MGIEPLGDNGGSTWFKSAMMALIKPIHFLKVSTSSIPNNQLASDGPSPLPFNLPVI